MKKRLLLFASILLAVSAATVSCENGNTGGAVVFELYDQDENPVEGVQSLQYGEVREYVLKSANVRRVSVSGPQGWGCEFYTGAKQAIITAPDPADMTSAAGGTVTVTITALDDTQSTFTMEVAAFEGNVTLGFVPEVTELQSFPFTTNKTYNIETSNTATLDIVKPTGWIVTYDLDADPQTLTITAPAAGAGDETGTVKVTPKSAKGSVGTAVNIQVEVKTTMPSLGLAATSFELTAWGEVKSEPIVPLNLDSYTVKSKPEGWTIEVDTENNLLKLTAPADNTDPDAQGSGSAVIEIENETGDTDEVTISLRLKVSGIACKEDFIEFANAVTAGTAIPERFVIGGEVTQVLSIDLSGYNQLTFVGNGTNNFSGKYNGGDKTVKINMLIPENGGVAGLFHTLAAGAEVKNLNVEGEILCKTTEYVDGGTAGTRNVVVAGAVAAYNAGASMTDCTTDVSFTYKPGSWQRLGSSSTAHYGSMSGEVTGVTTFTRCVSKGKLWMDLGAFRAVGGQVGMIAANVDGVKFEECINHGELYLDFGDVLTNNADNTIYGGIVGSSQNANSSYKECVNRGNMTIDWHSQHSTTASQRQVYGVGGIAGCSYGTFEDCENYGNLWGKDASAVHTRRYGGILGAAYPGSRSNTIDLYMTRCINHGEIKHTASFAGGIAGTVTNAKYVKIDGCINKGNIVNPEVFPVGTTPSRQPAMLGGLFGSYRGDLMVNCRNEGNITGQVYVQVGALVGEARLNWTSGAVNTIKDCTNTGTINVTTMKGSDTGGSAFLVVGGLIATRDGNWALEGCTNTGRIITEVEAAGRTKNIYYKRIGTGTNNLTADAATEAEQAITTYITETVIP